MIDILLVERKEKKNIGKISCSVEFSVLVGSNRNSVG